MKNLFYFIFVIILVGCNKEPGPGGTSSIRGKVYKKEINSLGQVLSEYYDAGKDVFIIYGEDDKTYDDKFSTSYDGSFEFTHLNLGKYTIFSYSRCDACLSGDTVVSVTIEITEKKKDYVLDDLIVYK
ncbi:MAG: hypothetical protein R2780_04090 [Crocinitomicaceae bacterium]|nr:hypothetical protein [Crocinitomicaceae bacterium]